MGKNVRFAFPLDIKLALDELFELRFLLRVSVQARAEEVKNVSLNTARSSKNSWSNAPLSGYQRNRSFQFPTQSFARARYLSKGSDDVVTARSSRSRKNLAKKMADVYTELSVIKLPLVIMTYKNVLYIRNELSQHRL